MAPRNLRRGGATIATSQVAPQDVFEDISSNWRRLEPPRPSGMSRQDPLPPMYIEPGQDDDAKEDAR